MAVADVWAFGTLLIAAFGLGTALLSALSPPCEDRTEFAALAASAGLGAMGVLLGLLGLFGSLHAARFLIPLGAATTLVWIAKRRRGRLDEQASRPFASSRRDLVQNLRISGNSLDDVVA